MGAPKLSDEAIEKAVQVLDTWHGKLTWERYLSILALELGHKYTKPAMFDHPRIITAWNLAKKRSRKSVEGVGHGDVAQAISRTRIAELTAKNERLQLENERLLEQFTRWAHNATRMGMSKHDLDRPLPPERPRKASKPTAVK